MARPLTVGRQESGVAWTERQARSDAGGVERMTAQTDPPRRDETTARLSAGTVAGPEANGAATEGCHAEGVEPRVSMERR